MKALVYEGPKTMNIREVPVPEIQDNEVLVEVVRVGICGSELSGYLGHNSLRKPPLVMGHEFSGVVAEAGKRVQGYKPGDRVTVNPLVSCGRCTDCLSGNANLCARRTLIGAGRPGAFARYAAVPEQSLLPLPDKLSFDDGALVEPFACAVRACRLATVSPADRMLILGAGPIGLFVLQTAQVYGLKNIVVLDLNPKRLEIVRELGGIAVSSKEEWTGMGLGRGFDVAVDAVGLDITRRQCMEGVKPGGRVVFSGLHSADSTLPVNLAIRNELKLFGAFGYNPIDFEVALDWLGSGHVDLKPWMKHAPLEEGQACFELLIGDPGRTAKIMLTI